MKSLSHKLKLCISWKFISKVNIIENFEKNGHKNICEYLVEGYLFHLAPISQSSQINSKTKKQFGTP